MTNRPAHGLVIGSLALVLGLAGGCGATQGSTESETHFLALCQDECGAGLECICGVCTKTCDSVDPCEGLAEAVSCELGTAEACGGEATSVCDVLCGEDADCDELGSGYTCEAGSCRRPTALTESETDNSDGSSTTGGSVEPGPQGNLAFELSGCTTYSGAVGPDDEATPDVRESQLPAMDGTELGRLVTDGQGYSVVQCIIDDGAPNLIDAHISGLQAHPAASLVENVGITIEDGRIDAEGEGEAVITIQTGGVNYTTPEGSVCTLSLASPEPDSQFFVEAGAIYARFDCPELVDLPTTGCAATGVFVLERCDQGG